jgi:hypothetical protein
VSDERTYGYEELATRIEQELGVRPSPSALRAAAAASRRTSTTQARPRVTAGLPTPRPKPYRTSPAVFSADEIDAWLADHPRWHWMAAVGQFRAVLQDPMVPTRQAVAQGRSLGLTWAQITEGLRDVRQDTRVRAAIHKAYRDRS